MIVPPFLLSPAGLSHADASAELREAPHVGVRSESKSKYAVTSYATPVAFAYLIPMSVTATSVGLFYVTRKSDATARGFLGIGALGLMGGVIAPPIVHLFHGNVKSGAISFSGSLLSTTAGGFVGLFVTALYLAPADSKDDQNDDIVAPLIVGFTAGALVFQGFWGLFDANELAYERR